VGRDGYGGPKLCYNISTYKWGTAGWDDKERVWKYNTSIRARKGRVLYGQKGKPSIPITETDEGTVKPKWAGSRE
jgi:hypothetical protein